LIGLSCAFALSACGGDSTGSSNETGPGIGDGDGDGSGDGDGDGDGSGDGDGDGDGTGDGDGDGDGDGAPHWDVLHVPDAAESGCADGEFEEPEFSYIRIANSPEGTISKVDTVSLEEKGRYIVRADSAGSPSRTSVNLSSDVAVANRMGGITKVIADPERCDPGLNGQANVQTSTGKLDVLPWGQDDCVAWHTSFDAQYNANRPAAWTAGELNEATCELMNQKFWTSISNTSVGTSMRVLRLNGEDGSVEVDFNTPDINVGSFGAYGGAVDSEDNFWFINYTMPRVIAKVDYETLDYQTWAVPPAVCSYGFTVDSKDRPWIGGFCAGASGGSVMFDPETEQFTHWDNTLGYGLQEDADGIMWLATFSPSGLQAIDTETLQVGKHIPLPGAVGSRGVSVDFYGYVWFVDQGTTAWRVETDAETIDSYAGLTSPYTYSDMTGWGLSIVAGGGPQG
jgi:hypothetical protein